MSEAEKLILNTLITDNRKIESPNKYQISELADNLYLLGETVEQQDKACAIAHYREAEELGNIKALFKLLEIHVTTFSSTDKINYYREAIPKLLENFYGDRVRKLLTEMSDLCQLEPNREEILGFIAETKKDSRINPFHIIDSPATAAYKKEDINSLLRLTRNNDAEANGYLQMLASKNNPQAVAALNIYYSEMWLNNDRDLNQAHKHAQTAIEYARAFEQMINKPASIDTSANTVEGKAHPAPNAPLEAKEPDNSAAAIALAASKSFPPQQAAAAPIAAVADAAKENEKPKSSEAEPDTTAEPGEEGQPSAQSAAP